MNYLKAKYVSEQPFVGDNEKPKEYTNLELVHSGNIIITSSHHDRKFLIDHRFVPTKSQKPVILFVHGFKGFKDWGTFNLMADYFANAGFIFLKMNFSHNGTTIKQPLDFADLAAFGSNNFSIEQDDIHDVIDQLFAGKLIDLSEINLKETYLIGHSRGGGAAILKASQDSRIRKVATLAAINDFSNSYPEEVMNNWEKDGVFHVYNARTNQKMPLDYQIVEDFNKNKERLNIKRAVVEMDIPFLATHGTADETLPVSMVRQIKQWNDNVEVVEIDGANHIFGGSHPYEQQQLPKDLNIAVDLIIDFFKNRV